MALSKKKALEAATTNDPKYLVLPIDSFSEEQIAAL